MNRIYQGRVSKVQRLKAGGKGLAWLLSWVSAAQNWVWTNYEKRSTYLRPCATDHLFSAIEEGRFPSEAGEEKWDGYEVHLKDFVPQEHENVLKRF